MIFRFLGYCFLGLAVIALAYDGMRMIADNGRLAFTTVEMHWMAISPSSMEASRASVESVNSLLWSPLIMAILVLPAWIAAAGLGGLLYLAGYSPPRSPITDGI